ncbi:MAG TPA: hypothetical protein VM077_03360 [Candidatus Limnocylindrales bacterium]|nr:hypothetical protein [Candidatus Limnocylindrales bacterium]
MRKHKLTIELKKATDLTSPKIKTTASGIRNDFLNNTYPLFFHSYNPQNSFIAVPPEWLSELATKAGEKEFAIELDNKIQESYRAKANIIRGLKKSYQERISSKE